MVGRFSSVRSDGNVVRQPGDHELREPLRARQVLEPVLAEVAERDAFGQVVLDELARRPREEHLTAVRRGADACGAGNVETDVAGRRRAPAGRVQPMRTRTRSRQARAAAARRARDGLGRAWERGEERVALRVDDGAVRIGDGRVDEAAMLGEQLPVASLPSACSSSRRAFDVREEERDCSGRQLRHVPSCSRT